MPGNMQNDIPLTSWMIDLESASKDVGQRSELGRRRMGVGAVQNRGEGRLFNYLTQGSLET
jgi:hypothetical protein